MSFFIPPVFLFGNNANRVPHDEEKKPEYKTASEAEIKVENWRAERIAELEEENKRLQRENDKLGIHIEAKDKAYMDLLTDYNYLKARIKRMEKAYLKFHDDFKKLDDELDNVIMNR